VPQAQGLTKSIRRNCLCHFRRQRVCPNCDFKVIFVMGMKKLGLMQEAGQMIEKEAVIFGKGFRATRSPPAPLPKILPKS
jgi:hypothetical protein